MTTPEHTRRNLLAVAAFLFTVACGLTLLIGGAR